MTIQSSGFKKRVLRVLIGGALFFVFSPILLIGIWWFGAMPSHVVTMYRFERAFGGIVHPLGSTLLQRHTYFGYAPIAGNASDGCYYYIADIRVLSDSYDDAVGHYRSTPHFLQSKFIDSEIGVLSVSKGPIDPWLDFFLKAVAEEALIADQHNTYIVYAKYVDSNMFGDFRCWVL